jgi:S-adenosylmethionine-diacylglycerol 3-amino-3-carboxypropyl transferase
MPTSDEWVATTAALPVAFAQVREDPRLDRRLVEQLGREARVLMIASGGETAALLATLPIESLHLVDPNPAQIELTKLKMAMLADSTTEERLRLLGHYEMDPCERGAELQGRMSDLGIAADAFGPSDLVAEFGPDFCARYEWVFARLRESLRPHRHAIRHLMSLSHVDAQAKSVAEDTDLGRGLKQAFDSVMELSALVAIFGPDATANRAMPFSEHFLIQTKQALSRFAASENPFLHQVFLGHFAGPLWDWLELPKHPRLCPLRYDVAMMWDVIATLPDQSYDLIHLSNVLDWVEPEQAASLLGQAHRCLSTGGLVVIRQLNSTLDIPAIPSAFDWQQDLAEQLHQDDRSFFYRELHVGVRR